MVQKFVPDAQVELTPMRAGEPFGGAVNTQEKLLAIVEAIAKTNPDLDRINIRKVARELGTVVSADVTTLEAIGIDHKSFKSLEDGISETVAWFIANENLLWKTTG